MAIDNKMNQDEDNGEVVDIEDPNTHYGINGISNLGNTCYINATLQCLFKIQPLNDYFMSGLHLAEMNESNKLGSQGNISYALGEIMK